MTPRALPLLGLRTYVSGFFKIFPQYEQFNSRRPKDMTYLIKAFHEDLIQEVIENRYGVNLPLKIGHLKIVSFKKNKHYPNFTQYIETGITTGFTNNHTDGLSCKIVYTNKGNKFKLKDKIIWSFMPEDPFRQKVSKAFRKNYNKYIFSPNIKTIDKRNTDFKWKELTEDNIEKFLLTYNELEL